MKNITVLIISLPMLLNNHLSAEKSEEKQDYTAEFTGEAMVKAKPDYVSLRLTVKSQCYENPLKASRSTDKIITKINRMLKELKDNRDPYFQIIIDGGFTQPFSKWYKNKRVCLNTFQKVSTIIFKMKASDDYDKSFAYIQNFVLKNFKHSFALGHFIEPISFVSLDSPMPKLDDRNKDNLKLAALNMAFKNAQRKFLAVFLDCKQLRPKAISVEEVGSGFKTPKPYYKLHAAESMAMSDSDGNFESPVQFDDLVVKKSLAVKFDISKLVCP